MSIFSALASNSTNRDSLQKIIITQQVADTLIFSAYYDLAWDNIYENPDTAYTLAKRAFLFIKRKNLIRYQPKITNLMGACFQVKGDFLKAIEYYQQSLKFGENTKDDKTILVAYGNIGALYTQLGQSEKALEMSLKSLAIAEKNNYEDKLASIQNNLSILYNNFRNYEKSLSYGLKSLALYKKYNDKNGQSSSLGNIGTSYFSLKNLDKALEYYNQSYQLSKEIGNTREEATAAIDIAQVYKEKNNFRESIAYYKKAEKIAEETEELDVLSQVYQGLYECEKATKQYEKALLSYEKFMTIFRELNKEKNLEEVNKKAIEFEFNKRSVRDSIANADKQKITDAKLEANKAQIQKDKILKMALGFGLALFLVFVIIILNRLNIIRKQKQIIEDKNQQTQIQKEEIEIKNKEILDSINYAKRIQDGLLANLVSLEKNFGKENFFILFLPKDIVSGDFYWSTEVTTPQKEELFYFACCDSTGHGVPGAFMSLLNMSLLSEAIKEEDLYNPSEVFNHIRKRLIQTIGSGGQQDGFDGTLLCINKTNKRITYASANNGGLLIKKDKTCIELDYNKMPVGKGIKTENFITHELEYNKGDTLYLYTDGYADQFGGPKGKKFKYKQLLDSLIAMQSAKFIEQENQLKQIHNDWKFEREQVDDILILGIKL